MSPTLRLPLTCVPWSSIRTNGVVSRFHVITVPGIPWRAALLGGIPASSATPAVTKGGTIAERETRRREATGLIDKYTSPKRKRGKKRAEASALRARTRIRWLLKSKFLASFRYCRGTATKANLRASRIREYADARLPRHVGNVLDNRNLWAPRNYAKQATEQVSVSRRSKRFIVALKAGKLREDPLVAPAARIHRLVKEIRRDPRGSLFGDV